jgi:3'-phosphoadenosine 5'-phosphosulfate sulfotransferase (PAPS reductase)/FAD synthetase
MLDTKIHIYFNVKIRKLTLPAKFLTNIGCWNCTALVRSAVVVAARRRANLEAAENMVIIMIIICLFVFFVL